MSTDTNGLRSRRALLGAGLGAAAATAAAAIPAVAGTRPTGGATYLEIDAITTGAAVTELQGTGTGALKVTCPAGAAVRADGGSGWALSTLGRLDISTAGLATISAGARTKRVYGGVDITSASFVLLTPGADIGSRRLWWTKDTTGNSFTIHLSSSRTSTTKVSWLLLG